MTPVIKYFSLLCVMLGNNICFGQQNPETYSDSIYLKAVVEKKDTNQVLFLFSESTKIFKRNPFVAKAILNKTLQRTKAYTDKKWIAKNKSLLGTLEYANANYNESQIYFKEALEIYKTTGYKYGQALVLNNLANLYRDIGELKIAIDYYLKALKIKEELNDKKGIVSTLNNMANLHFAQGDNVSAQKYYNEARNIAEEIKNPESLAMTYSNLANIYYDLNEVEKSYQFDTLALYYRKKSGDKSGIAISLNNIATYFNAKKDFPSALKCIDEALKIKNEIGDKAGIAVSKTEKGTIYLNMQQPDSAIRYLLEALTLAKELSIKNRITVCYRNLAKAYANKKEYDMAYEYERKYSNQKDTLTKDNFQKYITEMEAKYDTDKKKKEIELLTKDARLNSLILREKELEGVSKAKEIELLNKENEIVTIQNEKNRFEIEHKKFELENNQKKIALLASEKEIQDLEIKSNQANIKQQRIVSYFIVGGFLLAVGLSFFIFNSLKKQRKANIIISRQKAEVDSQKAIIEEHQKETIDSINYAKRIQYALLANKSLLEKNLPDHFVLFNPKDIVSGDFYWGCSVDRLQNAGGSDDLSTADCQLFYLAVCDSTGHGVPGAFMSLLNIGFLSEAIKEKDITRPNEVLNYVRQRLISSIGADGQQDGMDAILLCMEITNGKTTYSYAAANNEPVIIRNNEVVILPKDKMPVGKGERNESFNLYTIEPMEGDILYLYTDGYADQFGGPKAKKFKYKQLNDLLVSVNNQPTSTQLEILDKTFQNWKGNLEQVDDVCIIGIRLS